MEAHGSIDQARRLIGPLPKFLRKGDVSEFKGLRAAVEKIIVGTAESIKTGDPVLRQQIRMGKE